MNAVDGIGLADSVWIDWTGAPNIYDFEILADFPYRKKYRPPPTAIPKCRLHIKLHNEGVRDLYFVYLQSQKTMCLTYPIKKNAIEGYGKFSKEKTLNYEFDALTSCASCW